jgi:general secretion pathway protein D
MSTFTRHCGNVTLNAIDQTLPQLLTRIAKQVDMRFELDGPNPGRDAGFAIPQALQVDYVNMARNVTGTVSANTQIATGLPTGSGAANHQGQRRRHLEHAHREHLQEPVLGVAGKEHQGHPARTTGAAGRFERNQLRAGQRADRHRRRRPAKPAGGPPGHCQRPAGNPSPNSTSQATGTTLVRHSTFREAPR